MVKLLYHTLESPVQISGQCHDLANDCRHRFCTAASCLVYKLQGEIVETTLSETSRKYEGWNFNSGNYLFTTDTK